MCQAPFSEVLICEAGDSVAVKGYRKEIGAAGYGRQEYVNLTAKRFS